ncbi:MAG: copper chaperone PCu(A)C [Rhodobacterales bacterium]|nr:copper chaperone PCu(A)C [Rhodobacterales bacterium]MDX5391373.1 copper chaperone PCu(A)C [Rhodobacterales bacterium]MDX5491073.1 copper chaperone PCu(A)C [Rhodobacterales bacterium]
MSFKSTILAAAAAAFLAMPAFAAEIEVHDAYARSASEMAVTGGAFMVIYNRGDAEDRLIGASSDAAEKVELHTHKEDANGVMRMVHVEEGFDLPANGQIVMERGGHHVMFLGLKEPMKQGDVIDLVLTFEKAGDVPVQVEVDLERMPQPGAHGGMNHGGMNHGTMKKN